MRKLQLVVFNPLACLFDACSGLRHLRGFVYQKAFTARCGKGIDMQYASFGEFGGKVVKKKRNGLVGA